MIYLRFLHLHAALNLTLGLTGCSYKMMPELCASGWGQLLQSCGKHSLVHAYLPSLRMIPNCFSWMHGWTGVSY